MSTRNLIGLDWYIKNSYLITLVILDLYLEMNNTKPDPWIQYPWPSLVFLLSTISFTYKRNIYFFIEIQVMFTQVTKWQQNFS
jgi:hypothetical protein